MEIRLVHPEEHAALAELTVEAYVLLYDGVGRDMPDDYAEELRDVADRAAKADVLVAVDDGELLGGVTYVPGPESPYAELLDADQAGIRMLAVAPAAQGGGAGEALVRACIERARAAGRASVVLSSTDWMTTAHRIYERLGFERVPALDWVPTPEITLRVFRLKL